MEDIITQILAGLIAGAIYALIIFYPPVRRFVPKIFWIFMVIIIVFFVPYMAYYMPAFGVPCLISLGLIGYYLWWRKRKKSNPVTQAATTPSR